MGNRSEGRREDAAIVLPGRDGANIGTDSLGLAGGDGGSEGFILG